MLTACQFEVLALKHRYTDALLKSARPLRRPADRHAHLPGAAEAAANVVEVAADAVVDAMASIVDTVHVHVSDAVEAATEAVDAATTRVVSVVDAAAHKVADIVENPGETVVGPFLDIAAERAARGRVELSSVDMNPFSDKAYRHAQRVDRMDRVLMQLEMRMRGALWLGCGFGIWWYLADAGLPVATCGHALAIAALLGKGAYFIAASCRIVCD
jgi:hypothetical protein